MSSYSHSLPSHTSLLTLSPSHLSLPYSHSPPLTSHFPTHTLPLSALSLPYSPPCLPPLLIAPSASHSPPLSPLSLPYSHSLPLTSLPPLLTLSPSHLSHFPTHTLPLSPLSLPYSHSLPLTSLTSLLTPLPPSHRLLTPPLLLTLPSPIHLLPHLPQPPLLVWVAPPSPHGGTPGRGGADHHLQ